ncbi:MAG: response regulator [Treponema sp.]|nr:response regulator [Treponema sp.]
MDFTAPDARILAVDDQEINLMVLERLLTPTQVQFATATGGQEMLDLLCKEQYDLVLLDHVMPQPDGLESFRLSKTLENNQNKDTPFVALTGNDIKAEDADPSLSPHEATRAYYKGEGFADFLPKPVLPEELERILLALLPEGKLIQKERPESPQSEESPRGGLFARAIKSLEGEGGNGVPASGGGSGPAPSSPSTAVDPTLDTAKGLAFSGGDEEMYRQLLKNWADAYMESGYTIQKSAKEGDLNAHRIATHSLKSSSRMVGALVLGDMAEKAEHASRDGDLDFVRANVSALLTEYGKAVEAATGYLSA